MQYQTKEIQNQSQIDDYGRKGPVQLGPWTSHIWRSDPRHLSFLLARYKFCAKTLSGKSSVLEVGCGDVLGAQLILQEVESVHGIDFEPLIINDAKKRLEAEDIRGLTFEVHDITKSELNRTFDAGFCLDVIEHIPPELEEQFMSNICKSLESNAVFIIGTPNIAAQCHASEASAEGHFKLKSASGLKEVLLRHFNNVFIFSMNDEVVHTGFYPMAHYLIAVGVGCRRVNRQS